MDRLPRRGRAALSIVAVLALVLLFVVVSRPAPSAVTAPAMFASAGDDATGTSDAARIDAPTYDISAPIVGEPVKPVSFDGSLLDLPQTGPEYKQPMREMPQIGLADDGGDGFDPVVQTQDGPTAMPAPVANFKGLDLQNWGAGWPPDTHGDVGPNHYIQVVNTSIGIFDKATGTPQAAFTFNNFFVYANTPCDASNDGDPIALYDYISGRWILTDFAWSSTSGPFYECIAVSKTADPVNGGWWFYALQAAASDLHDYPKLGVWSDGIYMSANMFRRARTFSGVKVWALNRDDMINGQPLRNVAFTLGTAYASLLPADSRGAAPTGKPEFFVSRASSTTLRLWKFTVNWTTPSSSTFTGPTNITVASHSTPSGRVPQKSSSETLDTLGDRLMSDLQYRNIAGIESLWVAHTVASGGVTGIRWYEVRSPNGTPTVYQQGTYQPDSTYRWMPSLAVDKQGNMAVGYSVSSSTMFPAIRYAGRLATDALGTLGQGETTLFAGTGSQSGGYNRWGDYASMSVDPVDDCTFWFTTEYYETTGNNWQTRIGSFKYPGC
jgi:hypothetical protein